MLFHTNTLVVEKSKSTKVISMGKKFTYNLSPEEAEGFAETMTKRGLKNVTRKGNQVTFYDPRPIFGKRRKK